MQNSVILNDIHTGDIPVQRTALTVFVIRPVLVRHIADVMAETCSVC
jgi:hypothetical protein